MASEIEIVNIANFEKIQNFLNDSAYKEILENSETFNTRLCIERRLRMPFLDPQTGVAQTHCALFVEQKQRMPGFREGQIYTYPAARWRKPKRQYLLNHHHSYRAYQYREPHHHAHHHNTHVHQSSGTAVGVRDHHQSEATAIAAMDGNSMGAIGDTDSKDSHGNAEKEWFHEELDAAHYHHGEEFDDDFDSDDFDESYSNRGKRKRGSRPARRSNANIDGTPKRGRKGGGSRRRAADSETGDRRRRGAGANNNANNASAANTSAAAAAAAAAVAHAASTAAAAATSNLYTNHSNSASPIPTIDETSQSAHGMPPNFAASSYDKTLNDAGASNDATMLNANSVGNATGAAIGNATATTSSNFPANISAAAVASPKKDIKNKLRNERDVAQPSPYCDFCLGDQRENKKTNLPEELVSCSDCGRSGHPSCLQFTPNMIISVKRYRWQCIECKYCSICGTSDNDDQLLFCDDCDRGYHMYCLSPPLVTPPEGSWSCKLCMEEFHKHKN